MQLVENTE